MTPDALPMKPAAQTTRLCLALAGLAGIAGIAGIGAVPLLPSGAPVRTDETAPAGAARAEEHRTDPVSSRTELGPRRPLGPYHAPAGTRIAFDLACAIDHRVARTGGGGSADSNLRLHARLVLTVAARRPGEIAAVCRLADARIEGRGRVSHERFAADLARPWTIRYDDSGAILGYRFAAALGLRQRALLRHLGASIRFAIPTSAGRTFCASEADDTGTFQHRYERVAEGRITKTRQGCEALRERSVALRSSTGIARAVFCPQLGWWRDIRAETAVSLAIPQAGTVVTSRFLGELALRGRERIAVPAFDWDAAWESVVTPKQAALAFAGEQQDAKARAALRKVSLTDAVQQLAALEGADDQEARARAWERLAQLLRLRPAAIEDVLPLLHARALTDATACALITALGRAGTPPAQAALVSLQGSSTLPITQRRAAIVAMVQIEQPTPALLEAVAHTAGSPGDLARGGLLALGTLTPRSPQRTRAVARLLAFEAAARANGTTDLWLLALGNAGLPEAEARVRPYLTAKRAAIRASALAALRLIETPTALATLLRFAASDASPVVREQAVDSLADRRSPEATATLARLTRTDAVASVRRAALAAVSLREDPVRQRTLEHAARNDPSPELRSFARGLLHGS